MPSEPNHDPKRPGRDRSPQGRPPAPGRPAAPGLDRARVVAEAREGGERLQLLESAPGVYRLRRLSPDGRTASRSAPLFRDPAALAQAREAFPDHLPWMGMAVDGG